MTWLIILYTKKGNCLRKKVKNSINSCHAKYGHDILPQLLALWARLYDARNNTLQQNLLPLICIGTEVALQELDRYIGSIWESDFYTIAVGE
jgi:hypothetical protein